MYEDLNGGERSSLKVWNRSSSSEKNLVKEPKRELCRYIYCSWDMFWAIYFVWVPRVFMTNQNTVFPENCDM